MKKQKQMKKQIDWFLFDAMEDKETGEMWMGYTDGSKYPVKQFWLCSHPTKAFNYYVKVSINITSKEKNKLLNAWIENAIGSAAEYYDRILNFKV